MSIFKELLSIKSFRESKAEMAVRKQRLVLAAAISEQERAQQLLDQFRDYAVRHELAMYNDLCTRVVRLRDIEDVQLTVVDLRTQESRHDESCQKAQTYRRAQSTQLDVQVKLHAEASRMKQKFVELAQVYADEQIKELERKEDAEMEEVSETRRDRSDWDGLSEEAS